jgi:hypothetical protein
VVGARCGSTQGDALAERRSYVEDVPSERVAALDGASSRRVAREVVERSSLVLDFRGVTRDIEAANPVRL